MTGFHSYTEEQFLDEFVDPRDHAAVKEGADRQVAELRGHRLAELRRQSGFSQKQVAEAMGVSQQRISAIERGAISEIDTLSGYVAAIGGRLRIMVDFGGDLAAVA
jgi:DNA-binding XRE family transcriptional regulator